MCVVYAKEKRSQILFNKIFVLLHKMWEGKRVILKERECVKKGKGYFDGRCEGVIVKRFKG